MLRRLLNFAATVEIGTGLVLVAAPGRVVTLLLGAVEWGEGMLLGRLAGIVLVALGLACWPEGRRAGSCAAAFRGMLFYNSAIAFFLVYLFVGEHLGGVLLWPAVLLHVVVALLLVVANRAEQAGALGP